MCQSLLRRYVKSLMSNSLILAIEWYAKAADAACNTETPVSGDRSFSGIESDSTHEDRGYHRVGTKHKIEHKPRYH